MRHTVYRKYFKENHDRKISIVDSGATSHLVNLEKNMTNLKNAKTRVNVGGSKTLTGENVKISTDIRDMTRNFIL